MNIPLILFAKAPVPGRVKTRLQTHCSPERAAKIAEILMEQTVKSAKQFWPGAVYLYVWPDAQHVFLKHLINENQLQVGMQTDGDLGFKMQCALNEQGYPAVVMGCDVPHCPKSVFEESYQLIEQGENVIGPSEDGGYYLLGLQQSQPELFADMQWGAESVLKKTMDKADRLRLNLKSLMELNDVDEWSDLLKIAPKIPSLASFLRDEF